MEGILVGRGHGGGHRSSSPDDRIKARRGEGVEVVGEVGGGRGGQAACSRAGPSHVKEQVADTGSVSSPGWRRGGVSDPTPFLDGQQRGQPWVGICLY